MDFDLANKHKKEVEQRRRDAKRKLEQQKRDEEVRATMEQEHRERELLRLREAEEARLKAEQEARLNEGVRYVARLRPYPCARTDDKLVLPPSALEALERQGALDRGTLLTFSVALPSAARVVGGAPGSSGQTHAGVAEFTAEEGSVGVPPRVALCLTKGAGLDTLAAVGQVEIHYVRLPRSAKSRVKLQPRGQGFHAGGMNAVRLDLEHILQESLRGHTALTEGDWLPVRHGGVTYELVVRELEPEPHLALLDTDLTVEIMPSEQTEAELREEEERRLRAEEAARQAEERERQRLERARLKALALGPEPDPGPEVVQLLVRLPSGGRLARRFARGERLEQVLDWVESEPDSLVRPEEFRLVQKWPGHCRELGPAERGQTLQQLGFARQEALFLQRLGEEEPAAAPAEPAAPEPAAPPAAAAVAAASSSAAAGAWAAAEERAHEALDRRLEGEPDTPTAALKERSLEEVRGGELVGVFERLVALGMPPPQAAVAAKRFAAQLRELGEMGFEDWVAAVRLLERYNGRLLRVANLLSEGAGAGGDGADSASPAPGTPRMEAAAPPPPAVAPGPAAPAPARDPSPEAAGGGGDDTEKLRELASMGFADEERNRALLRKYAGRMERVVEALCSG